MWRPSENLVVEILGRELLHHLAVDARADDVEALAVEPRDLVRQLARDRRQRDARSLGAFLGRVVEHEQPPPPAAPEDRPDAQRIGHHRVLAAQQIAEEDEIPLGAGRVRESEARGAPARRERDDAAAVGAEEFDRLAQVVAEDAVDVVAATQLRRHADEEPVDIGRHGGRSVAGAARRHGRRRRLLTCRPMRLAPLILLALCVAVLFMGLTSIGAIDQREARDLQVARELVAAREALTPVLGHETLFEKPLVAYAPDAVAVLLVSKTPVVDSRLWRALAATMLVVLTVSIGAQHFGWRAGWCAGGVLATSLAVPLAARTDGTQLLASLLGWIGAAGLADALFGRAAGRDARLVVTYGALAAALVATGLLPALWPLGALALYLALARLEGGWRLAQPLPGLVLMIGLAVPWYGAMAERHGGDFLAHAPFFPYALESRAGWYLGPLLAVSYIVVGFFPWAALLPAALQHATTWWRRPRVDPDRRGVDGGVDLADRARAAGGERGALLHRVRGGGVGADRVLPAPTVPRRAAGAAGGGAVVRPLPRPSVRGRFARNRRAHARGRHAGANRNRRLADARVPRRPCRGRRVRAAPARDGVVRDLVAAVPGATRRAFACGGGSVRAAGRARRADRRAARAAGDGGLPQRAARGRDDRTRSRPSWRRS